MTTIKRRVHAVEDEDGNVSLTRPEATPDLAAADTAAALAGEGAGNVNNGVHAYLITFVTAAGETSFSEEDLGAVQVTVADKTTNGKVALTNVPTGSAFVTARKVYRTAANADPNLIENYRLLTTIANNSSTTYTDNIADASLTTEIPVRNTTDNPLIQYNAGTGVVNVAGAAIATQAALDKYSAASANFPKTTNGAQTLLEAADVARIVHIVVTITTTFAAGDGAAPSFNFGETDTPTKFKSALNTGTSGAVLTYAGVLSAGKDLLVTGTAATGTTSAGAISVAAVALPAAA